MADRAKKVSKNPQQAPQKSALSGKAEAKKHARHVNIVQRTTSESLRLESGAELPSSASADGSSSVSSGSVTASGGGGGGAAGKHYQPAAGTSSVSMLNAAAVAAARKPKTSSFQITSVVTKTGPRISSSSGGAADNGDDSADDLDESHAEDSSRVTDIDTETPSFSEDTFSKEDVFFTTSDAIGSAPVIPTSSQYGLAIVAPNMPGAQNLADVHVSVTDAGINLMTNSKKDVDLKDIHHRNERFKVVKIESTEPFRRGRWICMDYLDHSTLQPTIEEGGEAAGDPAEGGDDVGTAAAAAVAEDEPQSIVSAVTASDEGAAAGATGAAVVVPPASANESPGQTLQQPLAKNEINTNSSSSNNGSSNCSSRNQTSHAQTMAHISTPQQQQQTAGTTITASTTSAASINPSTLTTGGSATTISNQTAPNPSVPVTGNVVVGIAAAAPVASASPASQQVSTVGGTTPPQVQAQQPQSQPAQYYAQFTEPTTTATQQHGATLPAALLAQSVTISNQNTQVAPPQSQPPQVAVQQQSVPAPAASATGGIISSSMSSNAALPQQLSVSVDASPQQETSSTFSPVTVLSQPSPVFVSPSSSQQLAAGDAVAVQQNAVPNGPVPDLPISVPDTDIGTTGGSMSTTQLDLAAITHQVSPTSESTATTEQQSTPGGDSTTASLMSPSTIAIAAGVPGILPPAQQQLLQNIVAEDGTSNEDSESASGTSAVAIDNKIEQAMDLVKSHLMFAVREEVEVLKEKIAELMDRINQLEVENTILKANATQETLSQITAAVPPKVPPTNPQNGPVS